MDKGFSVPTSKLASKDSNNVAIPGEKLPSSRNPTPNPTHGDLDSLEIPEDLACVIEVWPHLDDDDRAAIMDIVERAGVEA